MALKVTQEYEKTGVMKITIVSNSEFLNFNNQNFRIDILDLIYANTYYTYHYLDSSYNDAIKSKVFSITKDNVCDYNYNSDEHLLQNGIQLYAEGNNLIIRLLQKSNVYDNGTFVKTVGFNSVKMVVAYNAYNDLAKNKEAIIDFNVSIMPGIHTGKIYKYDASAEDPTIPSSSLRTDFDYNDNDNENTYDNQLYVNTSGGNSSPIVPLYCVNSSAFVSEEYASEESDPYFNYENIVSQLKNTSNNTSIDIPYTILQDGSELKELTLLESGTSAAKVKCKVWEIRQEIYTEDANVKHGNQLVLSMDV